MKSPNTVIIIYLPKGPRGVSGEQGDSGTEGLKVCIKAYAIGLFHNTAFFINNIHFLMVERNEFTRLVFLKALKLCPIYIT